MKKEIKSLILKAKKGDPKSQHELAFEYWAGEKLKQDFSEAMKWWKLSASKGFGKAYFNLGAMYFNGDGVPVNYKEAYYYLNLSTKKRHSTLSTAYFFLGNKFFLDGKYGKKNNKKGIKYLEIAARKNCIRSQFLLASYYDDLEKKKYNIKKDKTKAFKYYKMTADNKFVPGLTITALLYAYGKGVRKNMKKATKYLKIIKTTDSNKLINELPFFPKDKIKLKKMVKKYEDRVRKKFNI